LAPNTSLRRIVGAVSGVRARCRRWRVLLVDQRCHGASAALPGLHPPHDMEAAAGDLANLVHRSLGGRAPAALVGAPWS